MKYPILECLRVKPFSYLLGAELFTQLGANIFSFYLILVVFSLTHSNTAVAAIVLSFTIPAIIFGIPAGVLVDKWDKKKVLITSNLVRAVLLVLLTFFHQNMYVLFIASFLISTSAQFFIPAESPMIPLVIKEKLLLHANALFGLGIFGSMLLAYILSGPTIIFFGDIQTLLILALLFVVSCIFIWLIKPEKPTRAAKVLPKDMKLAMKDELLSVLKLLSQTKEINHALFLLALSQVLILIVSALAPGYATEVLHVPIKDFPLRFIAPSAVGIFVGAMAVSSFHRIKKNTIITIGLFLSGLAMLILPYGSKIASRAIVMTLNDYLPQILRINASDIMIVLAFLLGFATAFVFVPANTILLEETKDAMRGKIYGVLSAIVGVFSLVPLLLAGGLSDLLGVPSVIIGVGMCLLLLGTLRLFFRL